MPQQLMRAQLSPCNYCLCAGNQEPAHLFFTGHPQLRHRRAGVRAGKGIQPAFFRSQHWFRDRAPGKGTCLTRPLPNLRSEAAAATPILYGAAYNVYVRAVRLALAEKDVPYQMIEVDLGAEEGAPANYLHHHSFMRIPAFEHEGERLYEASAITRYIEEAFDGPA